MDLFIFNVFLSQGFRSLNNDRKLHASAQQSYLNPLPEETGIQAWKRFVCAMLTDLLKIRRMTHVIFMYFFIAQPPPSWKCLWH